jgi:hypothetical protein
MVALDLFPAILSCGLSGYAQIVLAEALMQSYGPRKRERVFLHASELAELTGLDRGNARRAIKELLDAGIITPDASAFRFVKDYESWNPNPGPLKSRLGGRLLEWIHDATSRLGIDKRSNKGSESTQTQNLPVRGSTRTQSESTQTQDKRSDESTQTQPEPTARVYPDSSHSKDRAHTRASEDLREERIREIQDPPTPDVPNAKTETPIPGPEYTPVGNLAVDLTADWSWGPWVDSMGRLGHPAEWVRLAIEQATGAGKMSKPYVASILKGWAVSGGPPPPAPSKQKQFAGRTEKSPTYHQPMPKPDWMVAAQEAGLLGGAKK